MIVRPVEMSAFEFVVISALRTAQLMRGCTARVTTRVRHTTTAQAEVAAGCIERLPMPVPDPSDAQ